MTWASILRFGELRSWSPASVIGTWMPKLHRLQFPQHDRFVQDRPVIPSLVFKRDIRTNRAKGPQCSDGDRNVRAQGLDDERIRRDVDHG